MFHELEDPATLRRRRARPALVQALTQEPLAIPLVTPSMSRSLTQTIAALHDSGIAVRVTRTAQQELTLSVRDRSNGFSERKSFLPGLGEKAASWLHATAMRGCPESTYARQALALELDDPEGAGAASEEMSEGLRQGMTGLG
jgi:hypothetical protein